MKDSRRRGRPTKRCGRTLHVQALETRQLLAADFAELRNESLPEDVNNDGIVSTTDAFMLINRLSRQGAEDRPAEGVFPDVNGDGEMTARDALRVINRLSRGDRGPGPDRPGDRPRDEPTPVDDAAIESYSIDGTGNNLENPELGSTHTQLRRLVDSDYADGISEPAGEDRASPREISNVVAAQSESVLSERRLSDITWQWGQFLDHDIDLSAEGDVEAFDIAVPVGDPLFDPAGTGEQVISFTRSGVDEGTGVDSPAEQVNEITAFIDGSQVYGSDEATAASLRAFEGGRLLTSEGDLLPIGEDGFFDAGDVRANEQHGLTAMHTLWVREHNSIADEIAAADPSLSDEEIYQQARSIVIAEMQAITFNEYLPALLGRNVIPTYEGYDSSVDPTISNLFATAAFRYGHTSLSSELQRLDDDGNVIDEGNILLRDAFFNPTEVIELGIDPLLKGLASNISQEIDTLVVDDVRNFLFGPPGSGGFDLVSLNIQRGRDHGLPDYNSVREQLGLERAETFADITSDPELQAKLEEAYVTVDDIDVWVGALAEDHVRGASVGELTQAVLVEQFTALRDGDRLWYQNTFRGEQLREIESTRLSDVIERNTDLTSIQDNAFIVPNEDQPPRSTDRPNVGSNRGPNIDQPLTDLTQRDEGLRDEGLRDEGLRDEGRRDGNATPLSTSARPTPVPPRLDAVSADGPIDQPLAARPANDDVLDRGRGMQIAASALDPLTVDMLMRGLRR